MDEKEIYQVNRDAILAEARKRHGDETMLVAFEIEMVALSNGVLHQLVKYSGHNIFGYFHDKAVTKVPSVASNIEGFMIEEG